jgi:hypothetical protein
VVLCFFYGSPIGAMTGSFIFHGENIFNAAKKVKSDTLSERNCLYLLFRAPVFERFFPDLNRKCLKVDAKITVW